MKAAEARKMTKSHVTKILFNRKMLIKISLQLELHVRIEPNAA